MSILGLPLSLKIAHTQRNQENNKPTQIASLHPPKLSCYWLKLPPLKLSAWTRS